MAGIRLPEHSHCKFCGDPVPFGEEYCDDECRLGYLEDERRDKKKDYAFYGLAGLTIAVILAVGWYL